MSPDELPRRERWANLFQHATQPLFVLFRTRRIRFVNAPWEKLTGRSLADVYGKACVRAGKIEPLFRTLAPPLEAMTGRVTTVRRPVPPHVSGPPWWDITFVPLASDAGPGFLGTITLVHDTSVPQRKTPANLAAIRESYTSRFTLDLFPPSSPRAEQLQAQIRLAASTTAPVWIVGESGSGKETLARVIHQHSALRDRPFVALDCSAIQPYLLESMLFGIGGILTTHRVGTLLLKRPARLTRDFQQRISDWLRTTSPSVRMMCTSTTSAAVDVVAGTLRSEFQTAWSVLELHTLPLRDRFEDLPRLAERVRPVAADAWPIITAHRWPGNIREFLAVLVEAATHAEGPIIAANLPRFLRERALLAQNPLPPSEKLWTLDEVLTTVEKRLIRLAMARTKGNQTEAAEWLGIFRSRLNRRLEALGLNEPG